MKVAIMSTEQKRIAIKTGVPGTYASFEPHRPGWVRIILRRNKCIFLHGRDRSCYANGDVLTVDEDHPGTDCTAILGKIYSSIPGVEELRFFRNSGVLVSIRLAADERDKVVAELAGMIRNRSLVLLELQKS